MTLTFVTFLCLTSVHINTGQRSLLVTLYITLEGIRPLVEYIVISKLLFYFLTTVLLLALVIMDPLSDIPCRVLRERTTFGNHRHLE